MAPECRVAIRNSLPGLAKKFYEKMGKTFPLGFFPLILGADCEEGEGPSEVDFQSYLAAHSIGRRQANPFSPSSDFVL